MMRGLGAVVVLVSAAALPLACGEKSESSPRADAGSDADLFPDVAPSPTSDGGPPGADAGASGFCASKAQAGYVICADFDGPEPLRDLYPSYSARARLEVDPLAFVSPPASLATEVVQVIPIDAGVPEGGVPFEYVSSQAKIGPFAEAMLRGGHAQIDVRLDRIPALRDGGPIDEHTIFQIAFGYFTVGVNLKLDGDSQTVPVRISITSLWSGPAGPQTTPVPVPDNDSFHTTLPTTVRLVRGEWTRFFLDVHAAPNPGGDVNAAVTVQMARPVSAPPSTLATYHHPSTRVDYVADIFAGCGTFDEPYAAHFDNLLVTQPP